MKTNKVILFNDLYENKKYIFNQKKLVSKEKKLLIEILNEALTDDFLRLKFYSFLKNKIESKKDTLMLIVEKMKVGIKNAEDYDLFLDEFIKLCAQLYRSMLQKSSIYLEEVKKDIKWLNEMSYYFIASLKDTDLYQNNNFGDYEIKIY
jgi:hypothetical protein